MPAFVPILLTESALLYFHPGDALPRFQKRFHMTPKLILVFALIVAVIAALSAFVAYRSGYRHSASLRAPGGARARCIDFHEAGSHVGETTCISGQVVR